MEHELMDGFIMRDEGLSSHVPLLRDAYNPKRRIYCAPRGRMCWVALAMNCNAVNVWPIFYTWGGPKTVIPCAVRHMFGPRRFCGATI